MFVAGEVVFIPYYWPRQVVCLPQFSTEMVGYRLYNMRTQWQIDCLSNRMTRTVACFSYSEQDKSIAPVRNIKQV